MVGSVSAFLSVFAILLVAKPAVADMAEIPTYKYFYSCDSGVENCATFDKGQTYYGDFGMNGLIPTNFNVNEGPIGGFVAIFSNTEGEVLGKNMGETSRIVSYGVGGTIVCVGPQSYGCRDTDDIPEGINENGLYIFASSSGLPCGYVGLGFRTFDPLGPCDRSGVTFPDILKLGNFNLPDGDFARPLGINNENQILVDIADQDGRTLTEGIISPTPVPEPSIFALLTAVLCAFILVVKKRMRTTAHIRSAPNFFIRLRYIFSFVALPMLGFVLFVAPARADNLPTYEYFYTCDSGVENCADFSISTNTNALGESVQEIVFPPAWPSQVAYKASDGQVYCAFDCFDWDGGLSVNGINNNGIYLANADPSIEFGIYIGTNTTVGFNSFFGVPTIGPWENITTAQFWNISGIDSYFVYGRGINNSDQILVQYSDLSTGRSEGILSPFPVPELSSIVLLATALGLLLATNRVYRKLRVRRLTTQ